MAELLICCQDRDGDLTPKAGDVIDVHDDGWEWGECELGGRRADPDNNAMDAAAGFVQGELVVTVAKTDGVEADPVIARGAALAIGAGGEMATPPQAFSRRALSADSKQEFAVASIDDFPNGNHPFFRILQLPKVPVDAVTGLMVLKVDRSVLPPKMLAFRVSYFDIDKVSDKALVSFWGDDTRAAGSYSWDVSVDDFMACTTLRPDAVVIAQPPIAEPPS